MKELKFTLVGPTGSTYEVKDCPEWLSVTVVDDTTATVVPTEFFEVGEREGDIIFNHSKNTNIVTQVHVKQTGIEFEILTQTLFFPYTGGTQSIQFHFTGPDDAKWVVVEDTIPEWLSVAYDISNKYIASVSAATNNADNERAATLTFHHSYSDVLTGNIDVTQERFYAISTTPNEVEFFGSGGTSAITITLSGGTNPSYNIVSYPDWCQVEKTSDSVLTITVTENEEKRIEGDIILSHSMSDITTASIHVTYLQAMIIESYSNISLGIDVPYTCTNGETLNANLDWNTRAKIVFNNNVESATIRKPTSSTVLGGNTTINGNELQFILNNTTIDYTSARLYIDDIKLVDIDDTINLSLKPEWGNFPYLASITTSWGQSFPSLLIYPEENNYDRVVYETTRMTINFTDASVGDTIIFHFGPGTSPLSNVSIRNGSEFFSYDVMVGGSQRTIKCKMEKTNNTWMTATITELSLKGSNPGFYTVEVGGNLICDNTTAYLPLTARIYG